MKQYLFLLILALPATGLNAQLYLIDFKGSGSSSTVDSVRVMNLSQETALTMSGQDILALYSEVGIAGNTPQAVISLKVFPNPMEKEGFFEINSVSGGQAFISITDALGRLELSEYFSLVPGRQVFRITALPAGVHTIAVKTPEGKVTGKVISVNDGGGRPVISESESGLPGEKLSRAKSGRQYIYMYYREGDQLLLLGHSGDYTTVYPLVPTSNYTVYFNFVPCIDPEGHPYATVAIGSQIWMAQNLNTGVRINGALNQQDNGVREKYCFDDDETNCSIYGGMYQWREMMQYDTAQGSHGLCPEGWHLPTNGDYTALMNYLNGDTVAGGKMKETGIAHWAYPNGFATNSSGFTALPGGFRFHFGGFSSLHTFAFFWSSTQHISDPNVAWYRDIPNEWGYVYTGEYNKNTGLSVRCIKD